MHIFGALSWLSSILLTQAAFVTWKDIDEGRHGNYPVQTFVSDQAKAPYVNFVHESPACKDGLYYFITPRGWKNKFPGPMILDEDGSLIWTDYFKNDFGGTAYDLRVQKYHGEDYLTFWQGDDTNRGHGSGYYYMLNSSYDIVEKIGAAGDKLADLHEFTITPDGTALLMLVEPIAADLRALGRKKDDLVNQVAWDCLFQEVDIKSGSTVFEWRASEHLKMNYSYNRIDAEDMGTMAKPFDWLHLNSVDKDELGNYLVSARNFHGMMYIDGKNKDIIWTLGGRTNDFHDLSNGQVLSMAWQHDAKFVRTSAFSGFHVSSSTKKGTTTKLITVFDNAAFDWDYQYGSNYSRALVLEVKYPTTRRTTTSKTKTKAAAFHEGEQAPLSETDLEKVDGIDDHDSPYTVRLIQEYINPARFPSSTQGSVQLVGDSTDGGPHVFVGYGINAVMTDFYRNGSVACDVHFGAKTSWESGDIQSYRAYKSSWIGRPRTPPVVVAYRGSAYMSWNGATEVRQWLLQSSAEGVGEGWKNVTIVPKTGFETIILLKTSDYDITKHHLRVSAIDKKGRLCEHGVSAAAKPYRYTISLNLHLGDVPYLQLLLAIFGSAAVLSLLYRCGALRRGNAKKHRRLDPDIAFKEA